MIHACCWGGDAKISLILKGNISKQNCDSLLKYQNHKLFYLVDFERQFFAWPSTQIDFTSKKNSYLISKVIVYSRSICGIGGVSRREITFISQIFQNIKRYFEILFLILLGCLKQIFFSIYFFIGIRNYPTLSATNLEKGDVAWLSMRQPPNACNTTIYRLP